jgi:CelD/BcsL family acetyltransferase involved in cellulose biosynthesis
MSTDRKIQITAEPEPEMIQLETVRSRTAAMPAGAREKVDRVRVVRAAAELAYLRPHWEAMGSAHAGPMLHYDWVRICTDLFCANCDLHVVVAGHEQPIGIAPLFSPREGRKRLEFIGASDLYEPMDFLCSEESAASSLAEAVARAGLPVFFNRIPADSAILGAMRNAFRRRGTVITRPANDYPYITLDDSWTAPEKHLNSGRRSDLRRAQRIAESVGELSYVMLSPKPDELPALLEEAYRVEAAGWKARQGSALATDALRGSFYSRYAAAACERGDLRLAFLRIGGRAAAVQLAVESAERFWLMKIGYSEDFARCSPGMLLTLETIRYAARAGLRSYEFLGSVEPWTRVWTSLVHPCVSLRAYPFNLRGMLALSVDSGTAGWARLKARARRPS